MAQSEWPISVEQIIPNAGANMGKGEPLFAAGGMRTGSATTEISVDHPQKSSRLTTSPISTTSEHIP